MVLLRGENFNFPFILSKNLKIFISKSLFCLFCFGTLSGNAQRLLLTPCSGIISGGVQEDHMGLWGLSPHCLHTK